MSVYLYHFSRKRWRHGKRWAIQIGFGIEIPAYVFSGGLMLRSMKCAALNFAELYSILLPFGCINIYVSKIGIHDRCNCPKLCEKCSINSGLMKWAHKFIDPDEKVLGSVSAFGQPLKVYISECVSHTRATRLPLPWSVSPWPFALLHSILGN